MKEAIFSFFREAFSTNQQYHQLNLFHSSHSAQASSACIKYFEASFPFMASVASSAALLYSSPKKEKWLIVNKILKDWVR